MKASQIRLLLVSFVWLLCGFSCVAFREFQVRPYVTDPTVSDVTIPHLVDDYRKVSLAIKLWAKEQGLAEEPCQYYDYRSDYSREEFVRGVSPACQVFSGNAYSVHISFTPSTNSTQVSVVSGPHDVAESKARMLQQDLAAKFGTQAISGYNGGEKPNKSVEPTPDKDRSSF